MELKRIILLIAIISSAYSLNIQSPQKDLLKALKQDLSNLKSNSREKHLCNSDLFNIMFDTKKYVIEEYTVQTEDGYLNKLFRIRLTQNEKDKLCDEKQANLDKPVLLQHGLLDSSDGWFVDSDKSIGFHLLHDGYDVWAGNNRGNKYSLKHINEEISDYDYFEFCWDEMGIYDVPAFYKFIMQKTGKDKIIYFGHSEGTSQFFVGAVDDSSRDFITKHTAKFFGLAPIAFIKNTKSTVLRALSSVRWLIEPLFYIFGIYNIAPSVCHEPVLVADFAQWFCDHFGFVCRNIFPGLKITSEDTLLSQLHNALTHYTSGTGYLNLVKYAQSITYSKEEKLQRLDRGYLGNLRKYGSLYPPVLDVSQFDINAVLIGGTDDELGDVEDVSMLSSMFKSEKTSTYFLNKFDHLSFIFPRDPTRMFEIIDQELAKIPTN